MFELIREVHTFHSDAANAANHFSQLSISNPRGIGFADEAEKASDFIISGVGCGKATCDAGVSGNFEASMGDSKAAVKEYTKGPTGNSNYRGISADIINNALLNSTDYTGVVNADGTKAHKMYEDIRMTPPAPPAP